MPHGLPQLPHGMTTQVLIFAASLFMAVTIFAFMIVSKMIGAKPDPLRERLRASAVSGAPISLEDEAASLRIGSISPTMERVTRAVAQPLMPKNVAEVSALRRKFAHAGIYSTTAMQIWVLCKIVCCFIGIGLGLAVAFNRTEPLVGILAATVLGLIGMILPTIWLRLKIRRRQWNLQKALPDALDLMVVCVEAGLTVDAAIQRVGSEIALAHPDISRELGITHMETRVGVSRIEALRNLGLRTGSAPLQSLAAMLMQAERFGTSIGTALRVHAESLRVKRQHMAEERAAKTTVKLAFPVVLFIFPTVIAVLGGPAFILFYKSPLFAAK